MMKKFIFMEGFKDWPATASTTTSTIFNYYLTKSSPYLNDVPILQLYSSSDVSIVNNSFDLDGIKYSGVYLAKGTGFMSIIIPKFASGDKARTYIGGRMVGTAFSNQTPFYTLSKGYAPGSNGVGKFESTIGASYYIEFVIDHSTSKVSIYINKLKKFEVALTGSEIGSIAKGQGKLCFGCYDTGWSAFSSKPGLLTDFYMATETWDGDTAPEVSVFGPVSVDSYTVATADAPGFATDADSILTSLKAPYKDTFAVKDQPVYTNNDDGVGKFTFTPVPATAKPVAAMCSIQTMRGPSSGATLVTKITDGTKELVADQYVPTLTTAQASPTIFYDLTPKFDALTPEALNKVVVELNSKETL